MIRSRPDAMVPATGDCAMPIRPLSRRILTRLGFALLLPLAAACEKKLPPKPPEQLALEAVSFSDIPGWAEDNHAEVLPAILRTCSRFELRPDDAAIGNDAGQIGGTAADWRAPCAALAALPPDDPAAARASLEAWFQPFRGRDNETETGLVTGYYEAELNGALFPGGAYAAPVYARPADLVTVELGEFSPDLKGRSLVGQVADGKLRPYPARDEIEAGLLGGRGLELLWADDPVDVFYLHIQGSGKVRFPDGSERRIGYAMSNGRDFTGIGRLLLDEGKIGPGEASAQGIRTWLRKNPEEGRAFMQRNARYIFFRWIDGEGPIGAQGVALTPMRSIAVDPRYVPYGLPVFLDTTWPGEQRPLRRLMVAQDTGSAIKGPLRADFYWGSGEPALDKAGGMKQQGRFYFLLPKAVAERRQATS
jgi:membrane-bound lytic murein transglycosylase A